MFAWAGGALADDGLRVAVRHGLVCVLAAFAADRRRRRFVAEVDEVDELGDQLTASGWGSG